jgi:hypothetical protein
MASPTRVDVINKIFKFSPRQKHPGLTSGGSPDLFIRPPPGLAKGQTLISISKRALEAKTDGG